MFTLPACEAPARVASYVPPLGLPGQPCGAQAARLPGPGGWGRRVRLPGEGFSSGRAAAGSGRTGMNVPPPVLLLLAISVMGAAFALAAFVWAVRTGQLDPGSHGNNIIFEDGETGDTLGDHRKSARR